MRRPPHQRSVCRLPGQVKLNSATDDADGTENSERSDGHIIAPERERWTFCAASGDLTSAAFLKCLAF
jgi:hypothetical protein